MPGCAVLMEGFARGHYCTRNFEVLASLVTCTGNSLRCLLESDNSLPLSSSLSLAGTVRKLLWLLVPAEPMQAGQTRQKLRVGHPSAEGQGKVETAKRLSFVTSVVGTLLCVSKSALQLLAAKEEGLSNTNLNNATATSHTSKDNTAQGGLHDDEKRVLHTAWDVASLQRVLAGAFITLMQVISWVPASAREVVEPWTLETLAHVSDSSLSSPEAGLPALKRLAMCLIGQMTLSGVCSESELDLVWEQYAVTHCHGRLFSGCCYLGCTNLDGFSESALKTQLCSGCRRTRYCSVECQRAAWVAGAHSKVCKH